ncbi:DUF6685 family protein [Pseudoxanthomonas kaohsiungensis]|nr:DUF6685 family protein [Pseudoxanthomonas kaohsiungensis]KAF1702881.1 hypothetical protein CSC66_08900 [Pseudoxanthomonas kaohsiungensis]
MRVLDPFMPGAHLRRIRELLANGSDVLRRPLVRQSVALSDVPHWERFGSGRLTYWRRDPFGDYSACFREIPAFRQLVVSSQTTVTIDIRQIQGMAASKSDLHGHRCLDAWALDNAAWALKDVSLPAVGHLLHWRRQDTASDSLVVHDYDGRVFLSNSEGSHRFAAARYIAGQLGENVRFRAPLTRYSVDQTALRAIQGEFAVYAVRHDARFMNALTDAFRAGGVPYLTCEMPPRLGGADYGGSSGDAHRAILLPRASHAASQVIALFDASPAMEVMSELQRQCTAALIPLDLADEEPEPFRPRI